MEENYFGTGFDPLWSSYGPIKFEKSPYEAELRTEYEGVYRRMGKLFEYQAKSRHSETRARLLEALRQPQGGIPPELKKEKPEMGYNDDNRSSQQKIDDAVREAIEAPRREAEIAKRKALVLSLEPLADAKVGTVLVFTRTYAGTDFIVAVIKTDTDVWAMTGDGYNSTRGDRVNFKQLLEYLTTGQATAQNVQVATGFAAPEAPASTDASA